METGREICSCHPEYEALRDQLQLVRESLDGNRGMKSSERRKKYVPSLSKQSDEEYANMLERGLYPGVPKRTLLGLQGVMFRHSPKVELPKGLGHIEVDASGKGTDFQTFIREASAEKIRSGRIGYLVDLSSEPTSTPEPVLRVYSAEDITYWNEGPRGLEYLRVKESVSRYDPSKFVHVATEQYREFILQPDGVEVNLYIDENGIFKKQTLVNPTISGARLDQIPFFPDGTTFNRMKPEPSVLTELCEIALAFFRNSVNYEGILHLGWPTPLLFGYQKTNPGAAKGQNERVFHIGKPKWGPKDAKMQWSEPDGKMVDKLLQAMQNKNTQMMAHGAGLLDPGRREQTATEAGINEGIRHASARTMNMNQGAALTQALQFASRYRGGSGSEPLVQLETDFSWLSANAQKWANLSGAFLSGAITTGIWLDYLQKIGDAPQDLTIEEFESQLEVGAFDAPNQGLQL